VTAPRIVQEQAWREKAACADEDEAVFFPVVETGSNARSMYWPAKMVCSGCPVRAACLEHALTEPEYYGMWGGLTPQERQEIRVGRRPRRGALPASRLGQWRTANGYTKAYVAMLAGVSASAVAKWESGRIPMPLRMVELIEGSSSGG
jgi:WhiB family transcriptional regulator, redox-sensing transcriptional regulator